MPSSRHHPEQRHPAPATVVQIWQARAQAIRHDGDRWRDKKVVVPVVDLLELVRLAERGLPREVRQQTAHRGAVRFKERTIDAP